MQVSLTLFAFTGSAGPMEGVNVMSMRLTCTMQPAHGLVHSKLEILTERKSHCFPALPSLIDGVGRRQLVYVCQLLFIIPNLCFKTNVDHYPN